MLTLDYAIGDPVQLRFDHALNNPRDMRVGLPFDLGARYLVEDFDIEDRNDGFEPIRRVKLAELPGLYLASRFVKEGA